MFTETRKASAFAGGFSAYNSIEDIFFSKEEDNRKIYVTRSSLPPLEEFMEYLKDIWESNE